MSQIKCIFSVVLENDKHKDIHNRYTALENKVKNNNNNLNLDEKETKNYFIFSEDIKFENCNFKFDKDANGLIANLVYSKNNKSLKLIFILKKYEFKLQGKLFYCFETKFLKKYLEDEYKKKKFHLEIYIENSIKKLTIDNFYYFCYSKFEIVYNYNYKSVV